MKRILVLGMAACLILVGGCGAMTKLTVANQTSYYLNDVQWYGMDLGALGVGMSRTEQVAAGSDYLYFNCLSYWFRTAAIVTVETGRHAAFTLTDYTLIYGPMGVGDVRAAAGKTLAQALQDIEPR